MDTKISQNLWGHRTREIYSGHSIWTLFPSFLLLSISTLRFPTAESNQTRWRMSLERREIITVPLLSLHPWKEINIHPEIWCYANKTNVMPIANWAPATRFETIKDVFVSVSGAAWCLLPECITLPFTCYPWASEAGFKPMKKTVDLQGKCGRAPDTPNSRHAGCNCGYCGWEFRFTL